ncbi:YfiR family protein [Nitrogeniibacter mangrovi]|uniref:YfiR family protein n=1 Tax=Nitrogeniibacter mangrovi TaxID=2016596 RepID=A0A6C1AYG5_9RHOO|nr:YfiR/HmsC family protein [Nitrogeniibacter mangrovi]QID16377.1 YfiR family protein [Nitrogeniibacter mangrovi]
MRSLCATLAALILIGSPWLGAVAADEYDARRVAVGINLFPAVLAADQDIGKKRSGDALRVLLVYRDDAAQVERLAQGLRDKGAIRGIPLAVDIVPVEALLDQRRDHIAGVFVAQRLGEDTTALVDYCRRHHLLSFSPFEGDVERGVAAGIAVSDRVLPYVNVAALDAAGVRIKPFFLRIAERYEQP